MEKRNQKNNLNLSLSVIDRPKPSRTDQKSMLIDVVSKSWIDTFVLIVLHEFQIIVSNGSMLSIVHQQSADSAIFRNWTLNEFPIPKKAIFDSGMKLELNLVKRFVLFQIYRFNLWHFFFYFSSHFCSVLLVGWMVGRLDEQIEIIVL